MNSCPSFPSPEMMGMGNLTLQEKWNELGNVIRELPGVVVGLSGGVDSTLLAVASRIHLGYDSVVAATAVSPSLGQEDLELCRSFTQKNEIKFLEVVTEEFSDQRYLANDLMRCYYCKSALMDQLGPIAAKLGFVVVLGVNKDDLADHRPGQKAAQEGGARFPFVEASIDKDDIRSLAKWLELETWDRPQAACLASRIPFGTPVTLQSINEVDRSERALRRLGLSQLRVRHHGDLARLEVPVVDLELVMMRREEVIACVKQAGFDFVTLDLQGFRSGSMHEHVIQKRSRD